MLSHLFRWSIAALMALAPSRADCQDRSVEPAERSVEANVRRAAEFVAAEARRYQIRTKETEQRIAPLGQPVLRWSNPTGGEVHGAVVLWTRDGCPEAAASIYQFFDMQQANVELVSLSESPLIAERSGRLRWSPEPGVRFQELKDAPAPAESAERRRLQMRALARQFSGRLITGPDDSNITELRLMPQPLYLYRSSGNSDRDGAVFSLVTANDPEILLLIESRPVSNGRTWLYAAARMHFCRLQLSRRDQTVWDVPQIAPPWDNARGPAGTYIVLEWRSPEEADRE